MVSPTALEKLVDSALRVCAQSLACKWSAESKIIETVWVISEENVVAELLRMLHTLHTFAHLRIWYVKHRREPDESLYLSS